MYASDNIMITLSAYRLPLTGIPTGYCVIFAIQQLVMGTATIIGATGLVGGHIAEILSEERHWDTIRLLTRRPVESALRGTEVVVTDFGDPQSFREAVRGSDVLFCAVGTTRKKVGGDMVLYRSIDHDIPVNAAIHCLATGCSRFLMVSSVGASAKSRNYYLRFKGEAEEAIAALGLPSASIFRPSMLLGKRDEFRFGEEAGKLATIPLSFLFPSKYRPVHARDVARAMVEAALRNEKGFRIYHRSEMMSLAGR